MGKKDKDMIHVLGIATEQHAGASARAKVMAGSERLNSKSGPAEIAAWMKGAMDRLDAAVPADRRSAVRASCGAACAESNRKMIDRARAKFIKASSLEEYVAREKKKPLAGTAIDLQGEVLIWRFLPQSFSPPRRCFCGLMKGLPPDAAVSPTYCLCSVGFVETYWAGVLDKPVRVELLESCLSGGSECRFAVRVRG